MRISEMNWSMGQEYLKRDDRCILPLETRSSTLT
jgi:hypothetical protein